MQATCHLLGDTYPKVPVFGIMNNELAKEKQKSKNSLGMKGKTTMNRRASNGKEMVKVEMNFLLR